MNFPIFLHKVVIYILPYGHNDYMMHSALKYKMFSKARRLKFSLLNRDFIKSTNMPI